MFTYCCITVVLTLSKVFKHLIALHKSRVLGVLLMSFHSHLSTLPVLLFISSHSLTKSLIKYYIFTVKQELVPIETFIIKISHLLLKMGLILETKLLKYGIAGFRNIGFS